MSFDNLPKIFPYYIDGNLYGCPFPPSPWVHVLNEICDQFNLCWKSRVVSEDKRYILIICETEEEADQCKKMLYPGGRNIPSYFYEGFETKINVSWTQRIEFACHGRHYDLVLYPSSLENDERRFCLFTTLI